MGGKTGGIFRVDFYGYYLKTALGMWGPTHAILGASLLATDTKQNQIAPAAYVRERKASHERMTCPYYPKIVADPRRRETAVGDKKHATTMRWRPLEWR